MMLGRGRVGVKSLSDFSRFFFDRRSDARWHFNFSTLKILFFSMLTKNSKSEKIAWRPTQRKGGSPLSFLYIGGLVPGADYHGLCIVEAGSMPFCRSSRRAVRQVTAIPQLLRPQFSCVCRCADPSFFSSPLFPPVP